ncbi:hypothetical protein Angca_004181 [Angiostrongylus cantonensis]|nr:hypothetical protein Angca_004181 [Angiostrongylus cantonensis]
MFSVRSAAILAVLLWILMLYYLTAQLFGLQGKGYEKEEAVAQLDEALQLLRELRQENKALQQMLDGQRRDRTDAVHPEAARKRGENPPLNDRYIENMARRKDLSETADRRTDLYSIQHEISRRLLESRIWEVFYYLHVQNSDPSKQGFDKKHIEEQMLSLLATASNMSEVDGADLWRQKSLKSLTDFIQGKIHEMQHPEDCRKARILLCNLDKSCGFGCEMHHVAFCFMTAFGSQRTMVFDGDGNGWRYSEKGWLGTFLPITNCKYDDVVRVSIFIEQYSITSKARIVRLGIIDFFPDKPEFLPLSIPRPISEELLKLHSNPPVFFIGQFLWYLMRSAEDLTKLLNTSISLIPYVTSSGPIVGLQIRRTDKIGTEAAFHDVDEYIQWAEIWYKIQERRRDGNITRRVFVATDEPSVFLDIKRKFPHYEVYGDEETAKTAQLASRYTDSSLYGVIRDVRLLSLCNYIVCTFSSQVCRMGFELMQVQQGDAGDRFHSLDDVYYFGGQHAHEVVAVENHDPEKVGEIELRIGDVVGIAGNHWNGFSKGHNRRTGDSGFYPSYKVVEKWRIVDFPQLS